MPAMMLLVSMPVYAVELCCHNYLASYSQLVPNSPHLLFLSYFEQKKVVKNQIKLLKKLTC